MNESSEFDVSSSIQPSTDDYTPYEQRLETYLVPVLFFMIFVVGVLGNGTLVIIFLRHRAMRNVPNTDSFHAESTANCPVNEGMLFQIWYPFDTTKHFWICHIFDTATVFCAMLLFCYYKILPMSLIIFVLGQIKLVQHMMLQIDTNALEMVKIGRMEHQQALFLNIRKCLERHQEVIRVMNMVQSAVKGIVLIQYFTYTLDTAAFMLPILLEDSLRKKLRSFAGFVMSVLQMFAFFWYANKIKEESIAISDIIYNKTSWIEYGTKERMILLMIMKRSQKQLSLKAAAIGDMSLESFTKIMRLCYSIVTFFATVYDT